MLLGTALSLVLVYVINRQSFNWSIDLAVPWWQLGALSIALIGRRAHRHLERTRRDEPGCGARGARGLVTRRLQAIRSSSASRSCRAWLTGFALLMLPWCANAPCAALAIAEPAETAAPPAAVVAGYALEFPRDYGSHPQFRTEWWYVTGWLTTGEHEPLGFQITFFRSGRRWWRRTRVPSRRINC